MDETYPVEYQPRTSSLWMILAIAWWLATIVNLLLAFLLGNFLPLVIAVVAVVAAILFTLLVPVTRRFRHAEAHMDSHGLVLMETSPWWDRVSLSGRLRLQVTTVDPLGDKWLLVTGSDPFWGPLRVRLAVENPEQAGTLSSQLEGLRKPGTRKAPAP